MWILTSVKMNDIHLKQQFWVLVPPVFQSSLSRQGKYKPGLWEPQGLFPAAQWRHLWTLAISWNWGWHVHHSQPGCSSEFSSVAQSCPTLYDPMNCSTPGLPVHHQLQEFTQTHVHRVSDPIQPSHPLSFPSHPAPNPSEHQSLFQWVNSLHEVAKVLEFQL